MERNSVEINPATAALRLMEKQHLTIVVPASDQGRLQYLCFSMEGKIEHLGIGESNIRPELPRSVIGPSPSNSVLRYLVVFCSDSEVNRASCAAALILMGMASIVRRVMTEEKSGPPFICLANNDQEQAEIANILSILRDLAEKRAVDVTTN